MRGRAAAVAAGSRAARVREGRGRRWRGILVDATEARQQETVRRRVLVVEDDPAHARLMRRLLEGRPEVALETATNGLAALSRLDAALPDLLIIDAHLPEESVEDILAWVRRQPEGDRLPIVSMTADPGSRRHRRLLSLGVRGTLPKPIEVDAFLGVVDEALGLRRAA